MSTSREDLKEFREENLQQVRASYRFAALVAATAPLVAMAPRARDWVLRHHSKGAVTDRQEVFLRQSLDELLHTCGVINAGWCAGVLDEDETPRIAPGFRDFLTLNEVRAYYADRYPVLYMGAFLQRADGHLPRSPLFEPTWFAALLRLDASFRDGRIDDFLLVVDGYWLDSYTVNFRVLKDAVQDGGQIIEAVTTPWKSRTPLQRVIGGLERFLIFCDDLQDLLDAASDKPDLQDAAFLLYRYWFHVRGELLNDVMNQALITLVQLDSENSLEMNQNSIGKLFSRARSDGK